MTATVWNSADKNANITLSGSDLIATGNGNTGHWHIARSTNALASGKLYIEHTPDVLASPSTTVPLGLGVANSTQSIANDNYTGATNNSVGWFVNNGQWFKNAVGAAAGSFPTAVISDVLALLVDIDNGVMYGWNVTQSTYTKLPADITTVISGGNVMVGVAIFNDTTQETSNFGASAFTGTPPFEFASGWDGSTPVDTRPCQWVVWPRTLISGGISGTYNHIATGTNASLNPAGTWGRFGTNTVVTSGKYYRENTIDVLTAGGQGNGTWGVGIARHQSSIGPLVSGGFIGDAGNNGIGYFPFSGNVVRNAGTITTIMTGAAGDVICEAYDADNKRVWWRNGSGNWNNDASANPATNTNGIDCSAVQSGVYKVGPAFCVESTTGKCTTNFGQTAFTYGAPSGFVGWRSSAAVPHSRGFIFG